MMMEISLGDSDDEEESGAADKNGGSSERLSQTLGL
jgi:hypothetical protein